jgi:hypothetical protein
MKRILAWDTETFRFGPGCMAPQIVVSTWQASTGTGYCMGWWEAHELTIRGWLEEAARGELLIVGQNVAYDFGCLIASHPGLAPLVFAAYDADGVTCTMLRQKLIDIAAGQLRGYRDASTGGWKVHGYSLAHLYERWTGRALPKPQGVRTSFGDLWRVEPDQWPAEHLQYMLGDPAATMDVFAAQARHDADRGGTLLVDQFRQARAALALHLAGAWGIMTDAGAVEELRQRATDEIAKVSTRLQEAGLVRENRTRDMKAIHARMLEAWEACPRTPTGKPQINAETCEESGDAVLMDLSAYTKWQNVLSKDCTELGKGTTTPIHTRFDPLVDTGRTSSSGSGKGKAKEGHNIQNVKRMPGVRECYAPRPGHLYCACDFAQAELHTLAEVQYAVFGRSVLGDALNGGYDPHLLIAGNAIGTGYEEAVARRKDPDVKEARQHAKPVNFGLAGGMGARGLLSYAKGTYGVAFTMEQAERMIGIYHDTWPDMQDYFDWVRSLLGDGGSGDITHLYSRRVRGHVTYTVGCNSFFQGLAADGAKAAMWEAARAEYAEPGSPLYGCRTVNFVHDELIVEVPDDRELAHAAAMELQRIMQEAFNRWTPHCPTTAEPALMRRWSKNADPVWDNGMLVPWEGG